MGQKPSPGLFKRGQFWHIDKYICGLRIRESTGASTLSEAERYLSRRCEKIREAYVYGIRPKRLFKEAATKYLLENQHKASISANALHLKQLCLFVGDLTLEQVHMGSLQTFIQHRKAQGKKIKTVNNALGVVRHILNLAASEWIDENGMTWLSHAPKIKLLPNLDHEIPIPCLGRSKNDYLLYCRSTCAIWQYLK